MAATGLIGRSAAMAEIEQLLVAARTSSQTVIVRGQAGIGKTTLLRAVAEQAADSFRVIQLWGHPAETELPYAGVHQLMHRLDPELVWTPESDPFQTAVALLDRLADAAAAQPMLLSVDDWHWFDRASRQALIFASRRLDADPIAIVLGTREGELAGEEAGTVRQLGPIIDLAPLSRNDAVQLLQQVAPEISALVATQIADHAAGIPLALCEIPAGLSSGQLHGRVPLPADLPTSASLTCLFSGRIGSLGSSERLAVLACCFGPLPRPVRDAAFGDLGCSLADLENPERLGLVHWSSGVVEFRHPAVPMAMREAARRSELSRVHTALAGQFADDPARHALHLKQSGDVEATLLTDALIRAAESAEEQRAYAEAASHWESAADQCLPDQRQQLLTAALRCYLHAGAAPQAERVSVRLDEIVGDDRARAELAIQQVALSQWSRSVPPANASQLEKLALLVRESAADHGETDGLGTRLLVALATAQFTAGRYREAHRLCELLAEAPTTSVEQQLLADVVAVMAGAPGAGRVLRSDWLGDLDWRRVREPVTPIGFITVTLGWLGEDAKLAEVIRRCQDVIEVDGPTVAARYVTGSITAYLEQSRGRWDRAVREFEALHHLALDTDLAAPYPFFVLRHAYLLAARGDRAGCDALRDLARQRAVEWTKMTEHLDRAVQGLLCLVERDYAGADAHFVAVRRIEADTGSVPSGYLTALPDAIEARWHLGTADGLIPDLERYEQAAQLVGHREMQALALRCRGLLTGDDNYFAQSLDLLAAVGRDFESARTRLLWGQTLRRARRKSDAHRQLQQAEPVLAALGAQTLLETCRSELAACGGRRAAVTAPAGSPVAQLTPREFEVAREVAAGASNEDAARRLFISVRTVEFHLSKVFRKLDITTRADLPAVLNR